MTTQNPSKPKATEKTNQATLKKAELEKQNATWFEARERDMKQKYQDAVLIHRNDELGLCAWIKLHDFRVRYKPRRSKMDLYVSISEREIALNRLEAWEKNRYEADHRNCEAIEARKYFPSPFIIGNLLHATWGYDEQLHFYKDFILMGKATVDLRELATQGGYTDYDHGECTPVPTDFLHYKILSRRVNGKIVNITQVSTAKKIEPTRKPAGAPVYSIHSYSRSH